MILTDALADRVHALHVGSLRGFAEDYASVHPNVAHQAMGTGYALEAGEGSPVTQVVGYAHRSPGDPAEVEAFFAPRVANWELAVTPFTDPDTVRALLAHGYRFGGFESDLAQIVDALPPSPSHEIVEVEALDPWLETSTRAWEANEDEAWMPSEFGLHASKTPARRYLARVDGVPAAVGMMAERDDAVLLMGGATRAPYRGLGLQSALLARRLRDAGRGRLALMGAVPGSGSYRNAQRAGFTPLYSTTTLLRR